MKAYIYCTKAKPFLRDYSGKIVACFDLNKVEKMGLDSNNELVFNRGFNEESQLSLEQIVNYVGDNYYYAWHIDNLQVFDKPMELSEFYTKVNDKDRFNDFKGLDVIIPPIRTSNISLEAKTCKKLEKAPQNWQQIVFLNKETNEYEYAILISIKPEWVEKILNRKKIIEIRKTCPRKFKEE